MRLSTICCIGADHVGAPVCSVMAYKCPQIRVTVLDSPNLISQWNSDKLPFYEPDLEEIVKKCRNRNLFFSVDFETTIKDSDLIFISINVPTKTKGRGMGKTVDLKQVEDAARLIARHGMSDKIVVEKTTVPAKAAERIAIILNSVRLPGVKYEVLSNPQFLTEGSAVHDLLFPQRVLIGCQNNPTGRAAAASLRDLYENWVPSQNIITLNTWSAELSKLASNAFLAQRISTINCLSEICEESGADITDISSILKRDSRIGSKYLNASLGFGGLQKDILILVYICKSLKLPEIADYWQATLEMNEHHKQRFISKIKKMLDKIEDQEISIWGFAYKKDTSDTKNSPAIDVCKWLISEGAKIKIYDPQVTKDKILQELQLEEKPELSSRVSVWDDPYSASADTCAIVVCTEWDEFNKINFGKVTEKMCKPHFMIDGRRFLDSEVLKSCGFKYCTIGVS